MLLNPYLNQSHIYNELFLKSKQYGIENKNKEQIQCYQNCSSPSSLFLLLLHELPQQQYYQNVTTQNSKLHQCHSQFHAMNTNSNCILCSPNQPKFILPYNDNTNMSTLSYSDNTSLPLTLPPLPPHTLDYVFEIL